MKKDYTIAAVGKSPIQGEFNAKHIGGYFPERSADIIL